MLPVNLIAQQLRSAGWCHLPGCWPETLMVALRADLDARRCHLTPAGVGRARDHQLLESVRRDATLWLEGDSEPQRQLLAAMEGLRFALNRELLLGLFDYEAHYAAYPPGGFYRKHVDAFRGGSNRVLSTVVYLNPDWTSSDGGELVLWDAAGAELARLLPRAGDMLLFLSEEFPHEVLPARRERLSVAGWFRVNAGTALCPDPPS